MTQRWISNGPVQINAAGDFNIQGGCIHAALPDKCVLPRAARARKVASVGARGWPAVKLFLSALWFLATVTFWFGLALLVLAPLVASMLLSLCIWLLGRIGEQLQWIEFKLGGGPTQLAYIPTFDHSVRRAQLKVTADSKVFNMPTRHRGNEAVGRSRLLASSREPAPSAQLARPAVRR